MNVIERDVAIYRAALKNSGFDGKITYNDQSEKANDVNIEEANQASKRKGAIIWYNPPYSINVKTNIDKTFFKLLQKHFPPTHPTYTNIGSIISSQKKHILNSNNTEY